MRFREAQNKTHASGRKTVSAEEAEAAPRGACSWVAGPFLNAGRHRFPEDSWRRSPAALRGTRSR